VYCHGDGFTTTPVWDTTFIVANDSNAMRWNSAEALRAIDLADSMYIHHARTIQDLMALYDSLHIWVGSLYVDSDSTAIVQFNSQEKLHITLAPEQMVESGIAVTHSFGMLNSQRIASMKFLKSNPRTITEHREVLREIIIPEAPVTGRRGDD